MAQLDLAGLVVSIHVLGLTTRNSTPSLSLSNLIFCAVDGQHCSKWKQTDSSNQTFDASLHVAEFCAVTFLHDHCRLLTN